MADVNEEIKTAIIEFCRAQVMSKGGDRFALEGKTVTAIYVNPEAFYELCNLRGDSLFYCCANEFSFAGYTLYQVDSKSHPRVRVV